MMKDVINEVDEMQAQLKWSIFSTHPTGKQDYLHHATFLHIVVKRHKLKINCHFQQNIPRLSKMWYVVYTYRQKPLRKMQPVIYYTH